MVAMSRSQHRRRPTREATRERVLAAAQRTFAERGYHGASVDGVADQAGYSFGAVYSNFRSKEELFLAVSETAVGRQVQEYQQAAAESETIEGQAQGGAKRWMALLEAEPDYFPLFIEFWSEAVRDPEIRERFLLRYGELHDAVARIVRAGALERGLKISAEEAALVATVIVALGNGLALEKRVRPDAVPEEMFGGMLSALLETLATERRDGTDTASADRR